MVASLGSWTNATGELNPDANSGARICAEAALLVHTATAIRIPRQNHRDAVIARSPHDTPSCGKFA